MPGPFCPNCGKEMDFVEKDTMSGTEWRTYRCKACDKWVDVDNGTALWKILSDAAEDKDAPPPA